MHWDEKILPSITSKESVNRLAVLISGENITKLLEVPKILNGTGKAQAEGVYNILQDWNLIDRVQFLSFDTTASNTGKKSGCCTLLEQKLN